MKKLFVLVILATSSSAFAGPFDGIRCPMINNTFTCVSSLAGHVTTVDLTMTSKQDSQIEFMTDYNYTFKTNLISLNFNFKASSYPAGGYTFNDLVDRTRAWCTPGKSITIQRKVLTTTGDIDWVQENVIILLPDGSFVDQTNIYTKDMGGIRMSDLAVCTPKP